MQIRTFVCWRLMRVNGTAQTERREAEGDSQYSENPGSYGVVIRVRSQKDLTSFNCF